MLVRDRLDEKALVRVAGNQERTRLAAPEHRRAVVEPQVALLLLGVVTFIAFGHEGGADARFEELEVRRRRLCSAQA